MTMIIDGTLGETFPDGSLQPAAASPYVLRNRIINGAMVIDQRNAGASVNGNAVYCLDRWLANASQNNKYTVQQNAGSVTPPAGFTNYLGVTSSSAYTVGASEQFSLIQPIEGFNVADLGWGTANAKTVTLSFWVRSSLTGTFGGCFTNASANRFYVFSYTISTANTWTQINATITGDTSGTWATNNTVGMYVWLSIGAGSSVSGTAGSWGASTAYQPTGAVSVVGTNGATFYITGVQLEQNTSATPFERRLYNQELINCQRYFQYGNTAADWITNAYSSNATLFAPNMRTTPTIVTVGTPTQSAGATITYQSVVTTPYGMSVSFTGVSPYATRQYYFGQFSASAEL